VTKLVQRETREHEPATAVGFPWSTSTRRKHRIAGLASMIVSCETSRIVRVRFRLLRVNTESRYVSTIAMVCLYIVPAWLGELKLPASISSR
jgi:hypothetical protein